MNVVQPIHISPLNVLVLYVVQGKIALLKIKKFVVRKGQKRYYFILEIQRQQVIQYVLSIGS